MKKISEKQQLKDKVNALEEQLYNGLNARGFDWEAVSEEYHAAKAELWSKYKAYA